MLMTLFNRAHCVDDCLVDSIRGIPLFNVYMMVADGVPCFNKAAGNFIQMISFRHTYFLIEGSREQPRGEKSEGA